MIVDNFADHDSKMNVKVVFLYNIEHHHTCHDSKSLLSCQNSHHPYRTLRPQKNPERVQYLSRKTELIQSYGTFYIEKSDLNVMSIRIFLNYIFHVLLTIAPVKFQQWRMMTRGIFLTVLPFSHTTPRAKGTTHVSTLYNSNLMTIT